MKLIQLLFFILLSACYENGNDSAKEYPFLDYSQKKIEGFQNTQNMILAINNEDEDFIDSVYSSVLELVPYHFGGNEDLEIGRLMKSNYQDEKRVSFNIRINQRLKVKLEIHSSNELYVPFEYIRVVAYQDGYSYIRMYSKEEIYQDQQNAL